MVYEMTIVVSREDLDDLDHVNNVRYLQWVQDISKAHWESRAPEKLRKSMVWVVKQHLIEYRNAAKLGDTVVVRTYISKTEGAISTRVVEMHDLNSKKPLLRAETQWCLLHAKTFKPLRIPEEVRSVFQDESHS